ncbi:MAG: hypothetical protein MCM46_08960 [Candidatus Manganitrophus sp. SB1]|nr:hypothetical protein [Candidatus Manganitrophus morganii]
MADHSLFQPVLRWLIKGKGKAVYGGTRYKRELKTAGRYLGLFSELRKAGKIVEVDGSKVDKYQKQIEEKVRKSKFNDAHLIGIVVVSGCLLVCTNDKEAIPYLKRNSLYPKGVNKPKIYTSNSNKNLLCDANIAAVCKPTCKVTYDLQVAFGI